MILCVSHSFSVWLLPEFRIGRYFFIGGTTTWGASRSLVQCPKKEPSILGRSRQFRFFGSRLRVLKRWEYQTSLPFCSLFPKEFFVKMSQSLKLPTRNGKLKNQFRRSPTSAKKQRQCQKAAFSSQGAVLETEGVRPGGVRGIQHLFLGALSPGLSDGSKSIKFLSIKNRANQPQKPQCLML